MKRMFIDLTGTKVKTFTVIKLHSLDKWKNIRWHCVCECGQERLLLGASLRSGAVRCKCQNKPQAPKKVIVPKSPRKPLPKRELATDRPAMEDVKTRNGNSFHPLYSSWNNMFHRCYNPKCKAYHNYGGRGITVCERWQLFENFVFDMGERPKGTTLDRIDNNKGYSPSNCRWATRQEQAVNKRNNRVLVYQGESATITEWARKLGINLASMQRRVALGLTGDKLFHTGVIPTSQRYYPNAKKTNAKARGKPYL